jgi:hypothetical protein
MIGFSFSHAQGVFLGGNVFHVKLDMGVYKNKFGNIWGSCVPLGWRVG